MENKSVQLSIFEEERTKKRKFSVYECDSNYELVTDENNILTRHDGMFTLEEVLKICEQAEDVKPFKFGFSLFFKNNDKHFQFSGRIGNCRSSHSLNEYEYFINNWND